MRNNIAYFEKTSSSKVIFWAKLNAKINSALIFSIILTLLWLVFSKEAILFLIYLLADKAIYLVPMPLLIPKIKSSQYAIYIYENYCL